MNSAGARPSYGTVATFSRGVARTPHIANLLGARRVVFRPVGGAGLDAVVGWGNKPNTEVARAFASRHGLPFVRAEDGFLRSVGLGAAGDPPLSVVTDDQGIYYDARSPSRLELLLRLGHAVEDPALLARARSLIDTIVGAQLSKYNHLPPRDLDLGPRQRPRVLVIDQTYGDQSVVGGLAGPDSFERMLQAARDEHPDAELIVKTHPDVVAGKKRGYLEHPGPGFRLMASAVNPIALLAQVDHVYAVTSQLGFEAILAGVPVTCFGAPFYAGWGLTDDRADIPRRGVSRTREQLFAAAYLLYPSYIDPDSGEPAEIERVVEHLVLQRRMFATNAGTYYCFGFRPWKQGYVRAYLRSPGNEILFPRSAGHAERMGFHRGCKILVWGQRERADVRQLAARTGVEMWRMEDGFVRSVGLGSDLVTPASLVIDRRGIYYDPSRPSDLEHILEHDDFADQELERAAALRQALLDGRLSKYNVGTDRCLSVPRDRRIVLVPGQVEDDASIRLGSRGVHTNLDLLRAVRERHPDAYIIYKPHPDVVSRNRRGAVVGDAARQLCDRIELHATLPQCLDAADEAHVMTSLVGFEALLRDKRVEVYGQPFYAGWGLTVDHNPLARRTRRRSLDELVAATLIRYPRYLNRETGRFTTPEVTIEQLRRERDATNTARALHASRLRRLVRKVIHAGRGMLDVR